MNSIPDPSLISSEYGCSLIIGRSGSGKTYYVKSILRNIIKSEKKEKFILLMYKAKNTQMIFQKLLLFL